MEACSKLENIQCAKISLLIGTVCGATALAIIYLHLGHYGRLSLNNIFGVGYILSSFSFACILSFLGIKLSPELGISGCPLLCNLVKRNRGGIEQELKHALKTGLTYGAVLLFTSLGLFFVFRFLGRRIPSIIYIKMPPVVGGLIIGLNAAFYEEAFCRLGLLTLFAWTIHWSLKGKQLRISLWISNMLSAFIFMCFHHYSSPFELVGKTDPIFIAPLILPYLIAGLILGYCYVKHGYESAVIAHFEVNFIIAGILMPFDLLDYLT